MQQYVVPQFIDVENKILGPLTVRQFITFLVGFGFIFIIFKIFQFWIAAILGVMAFGVSGLFAFAKINGRLFHYFLLTLLQTLQRPPLQVWNKSMIVEKTKYQKAAAKEYLPPPKQPLSRSRLSEVALIVDTGGAYQEGIDEIKQ
ncbi:MAG: hypothetical protein A2898_03855 [Candidatus Kerfeldbacteria bacterium RIFCSPLOWO2_01_FULL_48_11]|uniref:PrgI family protein n=1 Tax=Candidatus Kerfeldbacteria bacterium RIFCSPLOWO2_01_FULL_48_11 TaxID=1798543 RepID=A0A1G2B6P6_9BACT|nr:MAG: hypothetical protein UY34_C0025G0007 [Parcubacteria group bacterium GW2011_GWA2_48_9]KKW14435.1 MAG: hypothetical protein UY52_C0028G0006 [Parcubacteria group bacterium GW2011_GWC2_49_9]OGY84822.1 MAG: hypothetical protein A2898_03855 [Candidatus Kerfeldbacteria bacterium RIFCSPLOWO2_01_FULL_48_11]HCJ52610.1 hypothetical protein [Candidatus Kerfeldbacteria bacterium]HCM67549.1 hypothetical protein [Candidatus Kerfeldbacteria bacterium]